MKTHRSQLQLHFLKWFLRMGVFSQIHFCSRTCTWNTCQTEWENGVSRLWCSLFQVCICRKVRCVFTLFLRQTVPKEEERSSKKEETLEMFAAVLRNWGPVLVKHPWSGKLPCESASLKAFSFCLTVPLKHQEISLQKPPFVFSESGDSLKAKNPGF